MVLAGLGEVRLRYIPSVSTVVCTLLLCPNLRVSSKDTRLRGNVRRNWKGVIYCRFLLERINMSIDLISDSESKKFWIGFMINFKR